MNMNIFVNGKETNNNNLKFDVNKLNCFIDLHLHLDGSLSVASAKELAAMQNISLPEKDEEIKDMLQVGEECRNLNDFLTKFDLPAKLLQTKESLKKAAHNLLKELKEDGIIYAEIRFAPQLHMNKGLEMEEVVQAVIDGMDVPGITANIILCGMRGNDLSVHCRNLETVIVAEKFMDRGVCAVDLAGAEGLFPTSDFKYMFDFARNRRVPFTIHAGEADGADSVAQAICFGASRIGHGIRAMEKKEVMVELMRRRIPVEFCPTSNLCTNMFDDIAEYPIRAFMKKGIIVTINTDDMAVCGTNIKNEYKKLVDEFDFNMFDIKLLLMNAVEASFASEQIKEELREKIRQEIPTINRKVGAVA